MPNRTYIPAFEARVGHWTYYICIMKYAEVKRQVEFAHELGGNKDLNTMIQRGISARTAGIVQYLLQSEHRFLGALIVAVWGGQPDYTELDMSDPEGLLEGLDSGFGVLTFDGTQQYFALDGQHRLAAIREALARNPELGAEDICVLIVPHYDSDEGRERTRRLFTNINRNAKTTTKAENIALDVDDAFSIVTRRLLTDHEFLKQEGRVRVFVRPPSSDGEVSLAGASVPKTDSRAWTTITVLYDLLRTIGIGLPSAVYDESRRPSDEEIDATYDQLSSRMDDLLEHCGVIRGKLESAPSARDVRAPRGGEAQGHAFARPVVQKVVCEAVRQLVEQQLLSWDEAMQRLSDLEWELGVAPWLVVFNPETARMITAKENRELLLELLLVHLAPTSRAQVKRARKSFKDVRGLTYPVGEEELAHNVIDEG